MSRNSRSLPVPTPARVSRPQLIAWCSVGLVVVVIASLVVVRIATGPGPSRSSHQDVRPAPAQLVRELSTVPPSVFDAVGAEIPPAFAGTTPIVIAGQPPLTLDGRSPSVLYYGAEYCPFCAAERWALAVALARFGTWSGLRTTASGLTEGDYSTLSFTTARLSSRYVHFAAVEACTNVPDPGSTGCNGYTPLQHPTAEERAVLDRYASGAFVPGDTQGIAFPYVDVDNRVLYSGSTFQPSILTGLSQAQIAGALTDPTDPLTRAVVATANILSASVCSGTGGMPASVCTSRGVRAAAAAVGVHADGG